MGYCRVVVVGKQVWVAGTAPIPPDGSPPPEGAYEQTKLCLEIIGTALERAGSRFEDVVRAHGEVFEPIRPVNTTTFGSLFDPAWKVEIDVDAVLP